MLDRGERDAIQLAKEKNLPLLIEEKAGREIAQRSGVHISGIAGQIVRAFRLHLLSADESKKLLLELSVAGRINKLIYQGLITTIEQEDRSRS